MDGIYAEERNEARFRSIIEATPKRNEMGVCDNCWECAEDYPVRPCPGKQLELEV